MSAVFTNRNERLLAAIGYVGILFMIPLFAMRRSSFAQFHGRQGLVLFGIRVIAAILAWIPFFGWALLATAWIVSGIGIVQALRGVEWELPYIGKFARKLKV